MKITEIKITAGKEILLLTSDSLLVIRNGKTTSVDEKLAAQLFKAVAGTCEKFANAVKELKP